MTEMNPSQAVYKGMKHAGINFVTSVPCVNLQELFQLIDSDSEIVHVPVTREEEGVGICAGAYVGGKRPALIMQNSGLGNSINALASLDFLYHIPLLMIISHRGGKGETIVGQVPMGQLSPKLLNAMSIIQFSPSVEEAEKAEKIEETIVQAMDLSNKTGRAAAVLLDIEFWGGGRR